MLDAGVGSPVEPEVAEAGDRRRAGLRSRRRDRRAIRALSDSRDAGRLLDLFWRTRSLNDLDALPPERGRARPALHPGLGPRGARPTAFRSIAASTRSSGCAEALAPRPSSRSTSCAVAHRPGAGLRRPPALAHQRSGPAVPSTSASRWPST
ncbi:hypothetical protein ACRAWD_20225 [Caulobacter segnis]